MSDRLSVHVFNALRRSSGAVIVLHPRGEIRSTNGQLLGIRSSVWINQEVALLAYRQFFERRTIPVLAFRDPELVLEGAMTSFIVNPKPSVEENTVLAELRRWLVEDAINGTKDEADVFQAKGDSLSRLKIEAFLQPSLLRGAATLRSRACDADLSITTVLRRIGRPRFFGNVGWF